MGDNRLINGCPELRFTILNVVFPSERSFVLLKRSEESITKDYRRRPLVPRVTSMANNRLINGCPELRFTIVNVVCPSERSFCPSETQFLSF